MTSSKLYDIIYQNYITSSNVYDVMFYSPPAKKGKTKTEMKQTEQNILGAILLRTTVYRLAVDKLSDR